MWHAGKYSVDGLKAAWQEAAFRQEAITALLLVPCAFFVSDNWMTRCLLVGSVLAVMVVELLNTAIELALDRVGEEWHALTKKAKDMGSAAVLITLLWCGMVWVFALVDRFYQSPI